MSRLRNILLIVFLLVFLLPIILISFRKVLGHPAITLLSRKSLHLFRSYQAPLGSDCDCAPQNHQSYCVYLHPGTSLAEHVRERHKTAVNVEYMFPAGATTGGSYCVDGIDIAALELLRSDVRVDHIQCDSLPPSQREKEAFDEDGTTVEMDMTHPRFLFSNAKVIVSDTRSAVGKRYYPRVLGSEYLAGVRDRLGYWIHMRALVWVRGEWDVWRRLWEGLWRGEKKRRC